MAVSGKRILVIFAHPDDAEFMCGGTIAKLVQDGNEVVYVSATDGNRGMHNLDVTPEMMTDVRRKEMCAAAHALGVKDVIFLGHEDGRLKEVRDLVGDFMRAIRKIRPDILITFDPWRPYESHPDHRTVGFAATEAGFLANAPWYYPEHSVENLKAHKPEETYLFAPGDPNYWVDISETIEVKIEAVKCHDSQVAEPGFHPPDALEKLPERIRSWAAQTGKSQGMAYAEAFRKLGRSDLEI
jgi:LmbE family N-acetylglucosaminyl deacetylase